MLVLQKRRAPVQLFSALDPPIKRNLWVLLASSLLFWAGIGSLLPTLSLYVQAIGGNDQEIGFVTGAFAIGLLGSRTWLGRLADQRSRKLVLLIGFVVATIAPIGYLSFQSIPGLIAIRIFHGICVAAFATAYIALVVDLSPPKNRGELIGYMTLGNPIGTAIGPALGGFVQQSWGNSALFLMAAGFSGLGLLCAAQVQAPAIPAEPNPSAYETSWQLLTGPRLRVPTLVFLLIGIAFGTLATFVPLLIKSTAVDLNPGFFYTAAAVGGFGVRLVVGKASDRFGRGLPITISLILYTLAMCLVWSAHSTFQFLCAGLIEGSAAGILIPTVSALIADRARPQERGRLFGLCLIGFDLGIAISGPLFGSVGETLGLDYRNMFAVAAGLAFLSLLTFITQSSKTPSDSIQFALGRGQDAYALALDGEPYPSLKKTS
jgi:MFS family permease